MIKCYVVHEENIHALAAASNSRNIAAGALLDTEISDNNFFIQSSNKRRRCLSVSCFSLVLGKNEKKKKKLLTKLNK